MQEKQLAQARRAVQASVGHPRSFTQQRAEMAGKRAGSWTPD